MLLLFVSLMFLSSAIDANQSRECNAQLHQIFSGLIDSVGLLYPEENSPEEQT